LDLGEIFGFLFFAESLVFSVSLFVVRQATHQFDIRLGLPRSLPLAESPEQLACGYQLPFALLESEFGKVKDTQGVV
jgi:hypothetical protein